MASPLTTTRNDFYNNRKRSDIETPVKVAEFIYQIVRESPLFSEVKQYELLDVACGSGILGVPFVSMPWWYVNGIDVVDEKPEGYANYVQMDFMEFPGELPNFSPDLIVCNPPFNNMAGEHTNGLKPELFIKRIFDLYGHTIPVVLFAPMGFIFNQRKKSKRWRSLRDEYKDAEITSIIVPPLDIFTNPDFDPDKEIGKGNRPNIEFHNMIMLWNIPGVKSFYWLDEWVID